MKPRIPAVPDTSPRLRLVRASLGLLGLAAVAYQLTVVLDQPEPQPAHFFSFFTIQSNVIACTVWLLGAWRPSFTARRPALRGGATLFLTVTWLVYLALTRDTDAQLGLTAPWVNVVLHHVLPAAIVAEWFVVPPRAPVRRAAALRWLLYPAAFFLYSMIRGFLTEWYPYPFLQPGLSGGYSGVLASAAVLLVVIGSLALAVAALGNRRLRVAAAEAPAAT